jgi:hypothetical protein
MSNVKRKKKMSYQAQADAEHKVKLMKNLWKIMTMTGGFCLLTVLLSLIVAAIKGLVVLQIFLYVVILVLGVFSIVSLVTTGMSIYFKITTLSEKAFKEAVSEIASDLADAM